MTTAKPGSRHCCEVCPGPAGTCWGLWGRRLLWALLKDFNISWCSQPSIRSNAVCDSYRHTMLSVIPTGTQSDVLHRIPPSNPSHFPMSANLLHLLRAESAPYGSKVVSLVKWKKKWLSKRPPNSLLVNTLHEPVFSSRPGWAQILHSLYLWLPTLDTRLVIAYCPLVSVLENLQLCMIDVIGSIVLLMASIWRFSWSAGELA